MMNILTKALAAALCAAAICTPALAAPAKTVTVYKAAKCGMLYTAAQAKKYHYACPDSKGKMSKVTMPAAAAGAGLAQTAKALAPVK